MQPSPCIRGMHDCRLMTHVHDPEPALACTQKDIVEMIADKREDIAYAVRLNRIDKQFGPGWHDVSRYHRRSQFLHAASHTLGGGEVTDTTRLTTKVQDAAKRLTGDSRDLDSLI